MTTFAMCFAAVDCSDVWEVGMPSGSSVVFLGSYGLKMVWINAVADATEMVDLMPNGNRSNFALKLETMGILGPTYRPVGEPSVTITIKNASPQPTGFGVLNALVEVEFRRFSIVCPAGVGDRL